ncbi:MAG: NAD-dependent epimerase/dehydratase family protein [Oleiphilaceae bacterium]|nr:NAD-dependent epimerase/dehydratase family protein [Oleiphilaceae bacterium]
MKVLVTGANGHIGANVVRELLAQQHSVRAFVRPNADLRGLEGLDIEMVNGDVMHAEDLKNAAPGCDAIIHLAAVYKTIADTPEEIVEPAVVGSRNVFDAAKAAGIKRIVYTSSIASIGFSNSATDMRTAEDWNDDAQNPYYVAKTQSEKVAQSLSREYDIEVIVLCPALVLGPHDYRVTPSNQLVMDWLNGKGQTYRGGLNMVDVRDVATAHVAALTRGKNQHRYIVGGDNMEVAEVGRLLKQLTGIKPMHLPFSRGMTLAVATVVEKFSRLIGIKPLFTRDLVYEVVERYAYYDCSATRNDLEMEFRPARDCLMASIKWLAEQGHFNARVMKKLKAKGI